MFPRSLKETNTEIDLNFELDFSESGWREYKKGIKIRNRIVHPRRILDLSISDEEVDNVLTAYRWFNSNITKLLKAATSKLKAKNH